MDDQLIARVDMQSWRLHSGFGSEAIERIAKLIYPRLVGKVDLQLAPRAEKIGGLNDCAARLKASTRGTLTESAELKKRQR
jgi:hypothetical protein